MRGPVSAIVLSAAALSCGCATYRTSSTEVSQAVEEWHRQRSALVAEEARTAAQSTGEKAVATSPTSAAAPGEPAQPTGKVVAPSDVSPLRTYIDEALERNPGIRAAIADARAKLERIPQATALEDPMLRTLIYPQPFEQVMGNMYLMLAMEQKFPSPVKLDRAGRAAAHEVRMAIAQLNATRLRVIADVEKAYYRLYLSDRSLELTATNRRLLETLVQVVDAQYRVGLAKQPDVLRVRTEISSLLNDEKQLGRQRQAAAAALNQLRDRPVTDQVPITTPVTGQTMSGQVEDLLALAEKNNPELAGLGHQIERDRERVKIAELGYWPDLWLGFEWNKMNSRAPFIPPKDPATGKVPAFDEASAEGTDMWALMFGVNLPIWSDRIEAAKREARHMLEQSREARRDAANMLAFRVYDAWISVQTEQDTIRLLESTLIPQSRQTYEVSLAAYQVGGADFLTVIDNWRNTLSFELMLQREIAGLETALADLQREVGLQLVRQRLDAADPQAQQKAPPASPPKGPSARIPPRGLEPPAKTPDNPPVSQGRGTESGTPEAAYPKPDASTPPTDPDLAAVVTAWPDLPEPIRAGIVAMVRAAC